MSNGVQNKAQQRRTRVRAMNRILRRLYPEAKIALRYGNDWELLVAVMLSAQCTDERVNKTTATLFKKYATMEAYARAPQREMERAVFSCGFYRNKAKNIRAAAALILKDFDGKIPKTMEALLTIPGVARKTANVVLSTFHDVHVGIAVDTHVRRFAIRFDLTDHNDPKRIERDLMELMPQSDWWGFNHRLVHYGRDHCPARKHVCEKHPLTTVYPEAASRWPRAR